MARQNLKQDPTRTGLIRRKFVGEMRNRFGAVRKLVYDLVGRQDVFGLAATPNPLLGNVEVDVATFRFASNPEKVELFRQWLQEQIDANILTADVSGAPWTSEFIDSSYKKGIIHGYEEALPQNLNDSPDMFSGGQRQFIQPTLSGSATTKRIEMIFTRTFEDLRGVTQTMSHQMSRILAQGFADGKNPRVIAREMTKEIDKLTRTRATVIARTEVIAAHAQGQLDAYSELGMEQVRVEAEWSTAGDDRVCEQCEELEGVVMSIKEAEGLIPRHPNCRCAWMPVNTIIQHRGQKRDTAATKAMAKSMVSERKKKRPLSEAVAGSQWQGKDVWKRQAKKRAKKK